MAQELKLRIRGLHTHPNTLSEVPEGALAAANNIVIDRESIAESRRGFKQFNPVLTDIKKLISFKDTVLVHDASTLYYDNGAGAWVALAGTVTEPCAPTQIQSAEQNKSLFFTSAEGVKKLASATGPIGQAGMPRGLDTEAALTGASGYLADDSAVAYRVVWARTDANAVLVLGSPSARTIVRNSAGGSRDVDLTFTVPDEIVAGDRYQIYRSPQTPTSSDVPSDELQLVIEREVTGADVTAGTITITDDIDDAFRGAFLYTSATQEGILQTNERPPLACDLTRFRQHMFYANTKQPHRLIITMDAQVPLDETVTIAGTTYTQRAAESVPADEFALGATITDTMRSLIRVINRSGTNTTVYAYELTDNSFLIEARSPATSSFTFDASDSTLVTNTLPATSVQEAEVNRVYISKSGRPEAVPFTNFIDIGSADKPILRILDVRDAVFALKSDGIYRITGTDTSNFIAEQHDSTIEILGANTAVEFNNRVYTMSNQGVVAISVSGVAIVSRPIERTLLQLSELSNFESLSWGVGYDSDRKYILACPGDSGETSSTQMFVYNAITQSWTRWTIAANTAVVHSDDMLYFGRATDSQVIQERKSFDLDDYADDEYDVTIVGSTSNTVDVSAVPAGVEEGMTLKQGTSAAVITSIDGVTLTLATADLPWTAAAASIFTPIDVALEWVEEPAGNAGVKKHYSECTFIFEDARFREITALFSTNFLSGFKTVTLEAKALGAWGNFGWGSEQWGGGLGGFQPIRTYFPKEATRAHWANIRLELSQAFTAFSLSGVSLIVFTTSPRFR